MANKNVYCFHLLVNISISRTPLAVSLTKTKEFC